jgi:tetraacyldisaccharide-1-P 4'-kinase
VMTVVCTEKDAIKLVQLDVDLSNVWSLDIDVAFDDDIAAALAAMLSERVLSPLLPMANAQNLQIGSDV